MLLNAQLEGKASLELQAAVNDRVSKAVCFFHVMDLTTDCVEPNLHVTWYPGRIRREIHCQLRYLSA